MTQAKLKVEQEHFYTLEEFQKMPEFGERYELIDGKLIKKPMPTFESGIIADTIRDAIRDYDRKKALGFAHREVSIDIGVKGNAPIPGLSYWKASRDVRVSAGAAPLPDLAVEVLSPGNTVSPSALKLAMVKVRKLLNAGVSIVWVVNPKEKLVEVYHTGQTRPVQIFKSGQALDGEAVIPGFTMPIDELFT